MTHLDLNPAALVAFGLCALILACWAAEPWLAKRRRRARILADRHARVGEDAAWANRSDHAAVAAGLAWDRTERRTHAYRAEFSCAGDVGYEDFALSLGEIDGGGT